jgi:aldehyde dehydrogenase (NAD+)
VIEVTLTEQVESHPHEIFVDGRWAEAQGGVIEIVNPATEEVIGHALDASSEEVDRAVRSARLAFDQGDWPRRPLEERIEIFERILTLLVPRLEQFAQVQTAQMGVPITVSRLMITSCTNLFRAYVDGARAIQYEYLRRDLANQALIRREPVGVVAAITPWNGPLATVINKSIPALLTGCTVVLKPAPETPLDGGMFAELCSEAGVPEGVFNVITGGRETGEALALHPGVDKLSFTGSTATGRSVGEICGRQFKRMSLELGGKSAAIVLPDAELDTLVPQLISGNFFNTGQVCIATTRVLVPSSRHDEIVGALREAGSKQVVGDPLDESTQVGPLVSRRQRDRVEGYVDAGRKAGADVVLGGGRPADLPRGWYFEPTIFAGVTNDMTIAREEIFGPVLSVLRYDTEAEAIEIANDSDYGLHGAVFSTDLERGFEVARSIQAGSVTLNGCGLSPGTPYGGVKGSGIGREHGREGVEDFLEYRSYVIPAELAESALARDVPIA